MSVDYDWYIHVYIPYLKRWICLKKFRFDYRCRSNTCYFEWVYSDSQTTMSPHYMDPVEFQFVTGEKTVIVDPKDPQHDGAVWDPNVKREEDYAECIHFEPGCYKSSLYDVDNVECFDKPFVSAKESIPLHEADGEELDLETYQKHPELQCFVCLGIARIFESARKLQYIPPIAIVQDNYGSEDSESFSILSKEKREEDYFAYWNVFLSRLFPGQDHDDVGRVIVSFLPPPPTTLVRIQENLDT